MAQYLHRCAISPAITMFQTSINKGNFITFPGIDNLNFKTLIGMPLATAQGHLDQERKNAQWIKENQSNHQRMTTTRSVIENRTNSHLKTKVTMT